MFVFNEFPENWTINMIIRQWCKQSFNTLEWTSIRLFPWDFHRSLAKSGAIVIRHSSKVQGREIWSGANGCSLHMCAGTYECKCVVCRERLESESLSTLVSIPWWGEVERSPRTRRARRKTRERSSTVERDGKKSHRKKDTKNTLVKMSLLIFPTRCSKYQNARNWARKKISMVRGRSRGRKILSRGKK